MVQRCGAPALIIKYKHSRSIPMRGARPGTGGRVWPSRMRQAVTPGNHEQETDPRVSVVIPCHNEAPNLEPLLQELRGALGGLGETYEIVVVDDGSDDETPAVLAQLAGADLRVIRHTRNFREAAALITGLDHARGRIVITMDADLQHDPSHIPDMIRLLEHADAVCPVRPRKAHPVVKRLSSSVANAVRTLVFRDGLRDTGYSFRAFRRGAVSGVPRFLGLHRFLPAVLKLQGCRVVQPVIVQRPRLHGRTHYGVWNRLGPGIADLAGMWWYQRRHLPADRVERALPPPEKRTEHATEQEGRTPG